MVVLGVSLWGLEAGLEGRKVVVRVVRLSWRCLPRVLWVSAPPSCVCPGGGNWLSSWTVTWIKFLSSEFDNFVEECL